MKGTKNIIYPEKFNSDVIKEHWDYKDELIDIIERSGFKEDFIGMYTNRLKFLEEHMYDSIKLRRK